MENNFQKLESLSTKIEDLKKEIHSLKKELTEKEIEQNRLLRDEKFLLKLYEERLNFSFENLVGKTVKITKNNVNIEDVVYKTVDNEFVVDSVNYRKGYAITYGTVMAIKPDGVHLEIILKDCADINGPNYDGAGYSNHRMYHIYYDYINDYSIEVVENFDSSQFLRQCLDKMFDAENK